MRVRETGSEWGASHETKVSKNGVLCRFGISSRLRRFPRDKN